MAVLIEEGAAEATEAEKRAARLIQELECRETHTAFSALRRKLLSMIKTFHPDRIKITTPTEVTAALTSLVEYLDQ